MTPDERCAVCNLLIADEPFIWGTEILCQACWRSQKEAETAERLDRAGRCANCDRKPGRLETPRAWRGSLVCDECYRKLLASDTTERSWMARRGGAGLAEPFKALGLTSRGQASAVMIVGLFLSPAVVGIPLLVWGALADHQMVQEMRRRGVILSGGGAGKFIAGMLVILILVIVVMAMAGWR